MDDLQFLLEEQGVISGDTLEIATETSAQKLSNLQQQLDNEKENSKRLQQQLEVCVLARLNSVRNTDDRYRKATKLQFYMQVNYASVINLYCIKF